MTSQLPLIKVVGISASGKSTLVQKLRQLGYNARPASQEHSQMPEMWRRIRPPDLLVYLHADLDAQRRRRPDVEWSEKWLATEKKRLAHAYRNADLFVDTSHRTPAQVLQMVQDFLQTTDIAKAEQPLPPIPETGGTTRQ